MSARYAGVMSMSIGLSTNGVDSPPELCALDACEPCESCGAPGRPQYVHTDGYLWHDLGEHRHTDRGCVAMTWLLHTPERCRALRGASSAAG